MNDPRSLFADYAAGEISAENLQILEAALRGDANLRGEFIEYMNIDSALGDLAALSEAEIDECTPFTTCGCETRPKTIHRIVAVIGSVAALVLISVLLWFSDSGDDRNAAAATIVTGINAVLVHDDQPCTDTELATGEYRLDRGLLNLRFEGGVMVFVEAPARFEVAGGKRLRLHGGRLSATVPSAGKGFTVETPEAEIVDFGTEFCVDVEDGASEVHVFEGLVSVKPRSRKEAVALKTAQAVKIKDVTEKPVEIKLATDRFIRNFDEPRFRYPRLIKLLAPVAYYRMPIRNQGMVCKPPQYSGVVLSAPLLNKEGTRPPNARGVGNGGALRVLAGSTGRGGRVDTPPPLGTGEFTMAAFIYLEERTDGTVATNIRGGKGNFTLSLDNNGFLRATIRNNNGELQSVTGDTRFPECRWRHVVLTAGEKHLRIYDTGKMVGSAPCGPMADSGSATLWFGTDAEGGRLWNGRIDELSLFDRVLSEEEIENLHRAAMEEMEGSN